MKTFPLRYKIPTRRAAARIGWLLIVSWSCLSPIGAAARTIEFENFAWGSPLLEVERLAEDHGFRLRAKDISLPEPRLDYRAFLHGEECRLLFSFTPLTGKLHSVTAAWDSPGFGEFLRRELIKNFGEPREEIPGAGTSIWTRRNTELTLRSGPGRTTLTYCHLLLKKDAREEKKILWEKGAGR